MPIEQLQADIVVIGSGGAGMMAALEAKKNGADVLIVGKGATGHATCTSLSGGFFCSTAFDFSPEQHYRLTIETGRNINDPDMVDFMAPTGWEGMH